MGIFLTLNNIDRFPGLVLKVKGTGDEIEISHEQEPGVVSSTTGESEVVCQFRRLQNAAQFDESTGSIAIAKVEKAAVALEQAANALKS